MEGRGSRIADSSIPGFPVRGYPPCHWGESKLHRAPLTVRGESQEWMCGGQDEGNVGERAGGVGRI